MPALAFRHGVPGDRGTGNRFEMSTPQTQAHAEPWMNKSQQHLQVCSRAGRS